MSTDTKLLAVQARIKVLREALETLQSCTATDGAYGRAVQKTITEALATPDDTAELDALIADARRLDALEFHLFEHQWNGVVGSDAQTYWRLAGNYRHTMQHMVGETFREAIDAMKEATP